MNHFAKWCVVSKSGAPFLSGGKPVRFLSEERAKEVADEANFANAHLGWSDYRVVERKHKFPEEKIQ